MLAGHGVDVEERRKSASHADQSGSQMKGAAMGEYSTWERRKIETARAWACKLASGKNQTGQRGDPREMKEMVNGR